MTVTALDLKIALIGYCRYTRQCPVVMDEVYQGNNIADVLAITRNGQVWDFEIKLTIADLRNDRKKDKHRFITQTLAGDRELKNSNSKGVVSERCIAYSSLAQVVPNRFVFVVPSTIAEKAKAVVRELYPYARLLSVYPMGISSIIRIKQIHNETIPERDYRSFAYSFTGKHFWLLCKYRELKRRLDK